MSDLPPARSSFPGTSTDAHRPFVEPIWRAATRVPSEGPGGSASPRAEAVPRGKRDVEWHAWFQNLGHQTRTLRELLGISQNQLARLAGVSQGAISRFERGAGRYTPAIVVFKIAVTLARHYRGTGLVAPAESLLRVIEDVERLVPVAALGELPALTADPQAEEVQVLFGAATPRAREAVVSILRSLCAIGAR